VVAMSWTGAGSGDAIKGLGGWGLLAGAFMNMLALLGWNDGTEQEIFSLDELVEKFSVDRINNSGAKFDFEKAKWFNQEWLRKAETTDLKPHIVALLAQKGIRQPDDHYLETVIDLVKE